MCAEWQHARPVCSAWQLRWVYPNSRDVVKPCWIATQLEVEALDPEQWCNHPELLLVPSHSKCQQPHPKPNPPAIMESSLWVVLPSSHPPIFVYQHLTNVYLLFIQHSDQKGCPLLALNILQKHKVVAVISCFWFCCRCSLINHSKTSANQNQLLAHLQGKSTAYMFIQKQT